MKVLSGAAVRRCIAAPKGYAIITADFDQIELRVAAALAKEQSLIDAAKRGESLHKTAAIKLWGEKYTKDQYRYTKNVNFGWLYGGGAKTLSRQAGIPLETARQIIAQYEEQFTALRKYKQRIQDQVLHTALSTQELRQLKALRSRMHTIRQSTPEGKAAALGVRLMMSRVCAGKIGYVTTPFGRRLIVDANKAYAGVNYIVQSSSRDIMASALLDVMTDPELEPTVLLPIHDEILGLTAIAEAEYIVQRYAEVMSREFMGVPIDASGKVYGKSWGHGYMGEEG